MNRDELIRQLKRQGGELTAFGVKRLAIFGSVARGEATSDSDVDVLVEFEGPATFDQYMRLKGFLEEALGRPVDLLTEEGANLLILAGLRVIILIDGPGLHGLVDTSGALCGQVSGGVQPAYRRCP